MLAVRGFHVAKVVEACRRVDLEFTSVFANFLFLIRSAEKPPLSTTTSQVLFRRLCFWFGLRFAVCSDCTACYRLLTLL